MQRYDHYKKKVDKKKIFKEIILIYFIAVIFVLLFNSMVIQAYKIPSNSMEPTLKENSRVLVNKLNYGPKYPFTDMRIFDATSNIRRGDIVVFMSKEYLEKNRLFRLLSNLTYTLTFSLVDLSNIVKHYDNDIYIKRVIGIPNDVIKYSIVNGKVIVLVNGVPEKKVIEDDYLLIEETEKNSPLLSSMILKKEYIVKEGEFYVLGDNRIQSFDSRVFGSISKKQIIGKSILKYWPINEFGLLK